MLLNTFRRILFLDLRTTLSDSIPLAKFKSLLLELEQVQYKYQPLYELEKERVKNARQEYYQLMIDNTAVDFVNQFNSEITSAKSENEKKYVIHSALKSLMYYLQENFRIQSKVVLKKRDEVFVHTAMKNQLVRLYLEVKNEQKEVFDFEEMEEVYQRFYGEPVPVPSIIFDAPLMILNTKLVNPEKELDFQTRMNDFRPDKKGILSYDTIIKNPKRFAEFEENLFLYGFIDEEYNFTNKHGMKSEMAMKYHQMINEGYFMPRNFKLLKDIKSRDIRKFLDYRYCVNLDKQFRTSMNIGN